MRSNTRSTNETKTDRGVQRLAKLFMLVKEHLRLCGLQDPCMLKIKFDVRDHWDTKMLMEGFGYWYQEVSLVRLSDIMKDRSEAVWFLRWNGPYENNASVQMQAQVDLPKHVKEWEEKQLTQAFKKVNTNPLVHRIEHSFIDQLQRRITSTTDSSFNGADYQIMFDGRDEESEIRSTYLHNQIYQADKYRKRIINRDKPIAQVLGLN